MATGKQLPNMPIKLTCSRSPIVIGCDHKNIVLTTGLFVVPELIKGVRGRFWFESADTVSDVYKYGSSDGVVIITSDAHLYRTMLGSADTTIAIDGSAEMYYYSTGAGSSESSFVVAGKPAATIQNFLLRGEDAFVIGGNIGSFVTKDASADSAIPISVIAFVERITYARSDGDLNISGEADAAQYRYDVYAPADYDEFITADGEKFVTVRSDDDGV